ncbi:hypothetical protein GCM10023185_37020 [Hymenobacter saemangeumensis]|uniref:Uncharacterized protein n=1 Tax=Hymenobacter saemangeumensis TaxID=1084522 RepID=A0ABP8IQK9_9BACT
MINLEKNWQALKDLLWSPFPDKQVYIDDLDNLMVIKRDEGLLDVVAYGHVTGDYFFQAGVLKFVLDVKRTRESNGWNSGALKFILNIPLAKMKYLSSLRAFPDDVEYFYFEPIRSGHSAPILQDLHKEIQVLVDRKQRARENRAEMDATDTERDIMNALRNGNGEIYGL